MLYDILLFVHVFAAIALLGPTYLSPVLSKLRGDPPSPAILRVEAAISRYGAVFAVVALLTGGWLIGVSPITSDGRFAGATWLHIGMFLFFVAAGLATGFVGPRVKKALAAAESGDAATARRLLAPIEGGVGPLVGLLGAVIVYLMVVKP